MVIGRITGVDGTGLPNNNQSMIHSKQFKEKELFILFSSPGAPKNRTISRVFTQPTFLFS